MNKTPINVPLLESKIALCGFKSQKSFAEAVGVTPHTIGNLLNGVYKPGHALISAIYQTLHLTPQEGTDIFFSKTLRNTKVKEVETEYDFSKRG